MANPPKVPFDPFPEGPLDRPAAPDTDIIPPNRAAKSLALMAVGFALALGLTLLLPANRYIRYQQANDSIMFHIQWIYERICYDTAPIDVAVVGASRLEAGVSPTILSETLSGAVNRPVHVANLSLVKPGRDLTYEIVKLLLRYHPEVKIIVLSDDGSIINSQPLFKYVADDYDILRAPIFVNTKYFVNLLFIPFRNISDSFQYLFPEMFGVTREFDKKAYLGTDLDRIFGYQTPTGEMVNGDKNATIEDLRAYTSEAVMKYSADMKLFDLLPRDQSLVEDRAYIRKIADLARQKGVKLAFAAIPLYGPDQFPNDRAFYKNFGPVFDLGALSSHPEYYSNGGHLNRQGAVIATTRLGSALAPLLEPAVGKGF